jgi:hypothetical protein
MLVCLLAWANALRLVTSPIPLVPTSGHSYKERAGSIVSLTTPCGSELYALPSWVGELHFGSLGRNPGGISRR